MINFLFIYNILSSRAPRRNNITNIKLENYILDNKQTKIVLDDSKYLLVVAGAGSGKTLTIIAKINYLILSKKVNPKHILCISFTNESINNLKKKINYDIDIFTFHKLSLEILKKSNIKYKIAPNDYLNYIIDEFFESIIYQYPKLIKNIIIYLKPWMVINYKNTYKKLPKKTIETLKKNIHRFISLFKAGNKTMKDFKNFFKSISNKNKLLLSIILVIYNIYTNELESSNMIDFDDMINKATDFIQKNKLNRYYKYIIIDEFQDSSYSRLLLIKKLVEKFDSNLMVVGDDFQSIYRFTGCDLNIFINFNNYFNNAAKITINNTYRNSQELINIAGRFVMENKQQIRKALYSNKHNIKPIKIIYSSNYQNTLEKIIIKIYGENNGSILILGRNNYDIKKYLNSSFLIENDNVIYLKNKDIKIRYLTIHKSKGLESDNIIIINLEDKINSFPNKMIDPKLLKLVLNTHEYYKHEEERRLFYVALTRTKNYAYLLCNKTNQSIFIKELVKKYKKEIEIIYL